MSQPAKPPRASAFELDHGAPVAPLDRKLYAKELARLQVEVVALPTTNLWLLGRCGDEDLAQRPLAPVRQLHRAGVVVAVGGGSVLDSAKMFLPGVASGDFAEIHAAKFS